VDLSQIEQNIISVKERVACAANGREAAIVAATKTVPAEIIRALPALGINIAGENRAQEFLDKYKTVQEISNGEVFNGADASRPGGSRVSGEGCVAGPARPNGADERSPDPTVYAPLNWHFIGRLQTNKVKYIIDKVSVIHSVDRPELAAEISRACRNKNIPNMDILIEVNMGGEESKGGVTIDNLLSFARSVSEKYDNITIKGLMPVLPINAPREMYLQAAALYDIFIREHPSADWLSMGMSDDFELAIACGSNMVRIGTAIFGQRS